MPNPSFTLSEIQQLQSEGLVLRYPDVLMNVQVTLDGAVSLLLRGAQQALTMPFVWSWIDRAQDGQTFIIFLPPHTPFPTDGIRWPEPENKFNINQGSPKELEVCEIKFGFVPGSGETMAARIRRRYRLVHSGGMGGPGAMPQLWVVHYTRGPNGPPIPAAVANQPVRMYPLRQVNEPPMFVAGEKLGQKAFPGQGMGGGMPSVAAGMGAGMPGGMVNMQPGIGGGGGPMGAAAGGMPGAIGGMSGNMGMPGGAGAFNQQAQALLAQQNSNMEMLEARRTHSLGGRGGPLPPPSAPGIHGQPVPGPHGRGIPPPGAAVAGVPPGRRPAGAPGGPSLLDDDDSGDEVDSISTRTLALTRYKRNHDLMNEVFVKASFGVQPNSKPTTSPYAIFDKKELDDKIDKLSSEIEALQARAEELKHKKGERESRNNIDVQLIDGTHTPLSHSSINSQLTVKMKPQPRTDSMDSSAGTMTTVDPLSMVKLTESIADTTTETASLAQIRPVLAEGESETGVPT
ncbi:hypothetical protein DFH05DRAFT_1521183 [Lentinula detonsa]|uniref:SWI/SNF and RSC complexes subunit Ssr4 N-terminal domain-containing protein n=1 Tax=Lentinula detonsa TaxID=2804962 RepID=A0A9W8U2B5_9AGAR|nr:hypothetical protein DFH05DRAFT_1521183 [Lentinula detonsa]